MTIPFNFLDYLRLALQVAPMKDRKQMAHDADPKNYPPHLQHLAPTDADLETAIEETTGKPVKPESAAAGVKSMLRRITELNMLRGRLTDQLAVAQGRDALELEGHIHTCNRDLAIAKERLTHYESQLGTQN